MARLERQKMRELAPSVRAKSFEEVCGGFTDEAAKLEAARCLNCKNPPCVAGCPVGVRIPEFIAKLKEGKVDEAASVIFSTNNLPAICGRVCPQEEQCEKNCVRKKLEGAVSIGGLERYVADRFLAEDKPVLPCEKNGLTAAVIGSGPSALSCAATLAKAGFAVTMFEAFHRAGGVLVYGIPEFRLPKALVRKEIENLLKLGVTLERNVVVGKSIFLEEIKEQFDYIFIGSGAGLPSFLKIPGESLVGVFSANEYLTRVNLMKAYEAGAKTPLYPAKKAVIVGGGNVAMDAARTALRMGAEVTVVYRRGKEEMPARKEEVRHAEEEGIVFSMLTNPVEVLGENGKVRAVRCVKMELGEADASGRRRPVTVAGSEFEIPCDMLIVAVGTSPNPILKESCPALKVNERGVIVVDEDQMTSIPNVYAGGDVVTGAATVILAMGAGKRAAEAMIAKSGLKK